MRIVYMLVLAVSLANSAPARGGVMKFEQPDGSSFNGLLKGDGAFHWIESEGEVVLFNSKDKFYYKAVIGSNGKVQLTDEKMKRQLSKAPALRRVANEKSHEVTKKTHQSLMKLVREAKKGNYPR